MFKGFKGFMAGVILAVGLAVFYLGQVAVIAVAGIALGLVLGEVVDALGTAAKGTRPSGESRVKSRDL
jgi:hypothetical protein